MKYLRIIILAVLALNVTGCKKWLDVNIDPATPQSTKAEYLLSPIISQMANNTANDNRVIFKYTQDMVGQDQTSFTLNWEKHGYQSSSDLGGSMWRMVYVNLGPNLESLIEDAEASGKWTYAGIGYAIKAWGYQLLTDASGPIILDQAFEKGRLQFEYQDQPEVYAKVRFWANKALECFKKTDQPKTLELLQNAQTGDQMYLGDRAKWTKFIYGLLAQQYGHLTNKTTDFNAKYADSVIKYVDLSFASSAEDATIRFQGSKAADSNPFSLDAGLFTPTVTTGSTYGRASQQIYTLLTGGIRGVAPVDPTVSTIDPRLTRMLNPIPVTGVYRGAVPLLGTATTPHILGALSGTSLAPYPEKYVFGKTARYPIMTYAQLQFSKAEALFRKGSTTLALATYKNAIRGHMDFINKWGLNGTGATAIPQTAIDNYVNTSTEVAQNIVQLTLKDIMLQKYIAQWGWAGMEQWSDMRRYHYEAATYPYFTQLTGGDLFEANAGKYAYRLRPRFSSEYTWNRAELDKWGGRKADYHTLETWSNLP